MANSQMEILVGRVDPKYWWLLLVRGVLLFILGLYALVTPIAAVITLIWVLAIFWIVDGVFALVGWAGGGFPGLKWVWLRALLAIIAGIMVVTNPAMGFFVEIVLIYVVAGVAIVSGIVEISAALKADKASQGRGSMLFAGFATLLFGILILLAPVVSIVVMTWFFGALAVLAGISLVAASLKLRKSKA